MDRSPGDGDRAPAEPPTATGLQIAPGTPASDRPTTDRQTTGPPDEPRQRWRLVLRRSPEAARLVQRETIDAFETALAASGLPLVTSGKARSRIMFGAALPAGMAADRELADLVLADRVPVADVRDRLATHLPAGWSLVEAFDVWLGEPSLVSQVVAAEYRVTLDGADAGRLWDAVAALLRADSLPRRREKGGGSVAYDLRPLLDHVTVVSADPATDPAVADQAAADPAGVTLRLRTRMHPELGTGRPEEVVAALGDELGVALAVRSIVRERLILAGDAG
ncbi:MAG TPA: TIGR03936 family radical SAM-associated protein [Candidatus Limnocylindrales bacterium]|nr:TIGR03936 family radical SAM-associated protein [Candidatus Limnocylindrales bacterium]